MIPQGAPLDIPSASAQLDRIGSRVSVRDSEERYINISLDRARYSTYHQAYYESACLKFVDELRFMLHSVHPKFTNSPRKSSLRVLKTIFPRWTRTDISIDHM